MVRCNNTQSLGKLHHKNNLLADLVLRKITLQKLFTHWLNYSGPQ